MAVARVNKKNTILMLGTSVNTKGGISSVVQTYMDSGFMDEMGVHYIATHVDGGRFRKLLLAIFAYIEFLWVLATEPIKIVHVHSASRASFYRKSVFILTARLFRKKIIFHLHGGGFRNVFYDRAPKIIQKVIVGLLGMVDIVIVLSGQWKTHMDEVVGKSVPIRVVYNSVLEPEKVRRDSLGKPPVILYLGLVSKEKGIDDLLVALGELSKRIVFKVKIAGNGDLDAYQQQARKLNIESQVEFLGWVGREDKDSLLREADLLVLPSYNEGMPMSLLEAYSYQVPVVASRVGGIPDLVVDGETGYLIEAGDCQELAECIFRVITDPIRHRAMSQKAVSVLRERFGVSTTKTVLKSVYEELLAGA